MRTINSIVITHITDRIIGGIDLVFDAVSVEEQPTAQASGAIELIHCLSKIAEFDPRFGRFGFLG